VLASNQFPNPAMQANRIPSGSESTSRRARLSCVSAIFAEQLPPMEVEATAGQLWKCEPLTSFGASKVAYPEGAKASANNYGMSHL